MWRRVPISIQGNLLYHKFTYNYFSTFFGVKSESEVLLFSRNGKNPIIGKKGRYMWIFVWRQLGKFEWMHIGEESILKYLVNSENLDNLEIPDNPAIIIVTEKMWKADIIGIELLVTCGAECKNYITYFLPLNGWRFFINSGQNRRFFFINFYHFFYQFLSIFLSINLSINFLSILLPHAASNQRYLAVQTFGLVLKW